MNNFECTLSSQEYLMASLAGAMRHTNSLFNNYKQSAGLEKANWDIEINGALAEAAFAKIIGAYWNPASNLDGKPDVGIYQVRGTVYLNGYLIVRPGNSSKDIFVLVTGKGPIFRYVGWMYGKDAMKDNFWFVPKDKRDSPYWRIFQEYLCSPSTLPTELLKI